MSWFSKWFGLDHNKPLLAVINNIGHEAGNVILDNLPIGDIHARIGGAVDSTVGRIVSAFPLPHDEAGIAKLILATEIKAAVDKELSAFVPVPESALGQNGLPLQNELPLQGEAPLQANPTLVVGG